MEKVISIGGQDVRLKSTAATMLRYKAQFRSDFMKDILKLGNFERMMKGEDVEGDIEVLFNIVWIFAKTADPTIPPVVEWFDQFDSFDLADVMNEIQDILFNAMLTKKK